MTIFELARLPRTQAIVLYLKAHGLGGDGTQGRRVPDFQAMSREQIAAATAGRLP